MEASEWTTVLNMRVDATSYSHATQNILKWSQSNESRYVCMANVHMTMEAYDDTEFSKVVNDADLVTPDGMPLVWILRWKGIRRQERVCGPELTLRLCEDLARSRVPVGFYGSSPDTLAELVGSLKSRIPGLEVVYTHSPPYRELSAEEDEHVVQEINRTGARVLFVGLGCPKQERWMARHRGHVNAVMLGVGAAFDFHAGKIQQAPKWMQRAGLEWSFRLIMEPRRLWQRYFKHNPRFVGLIAMELIFSRWGFPYRTR